MIFDSLGFPRDNGATDFQDSARLAGVMAVFSHPKAVDCRQYLVNGRYQRHSVERHYDFSRDQALCLMAGLRFQGHLDAVKLEYVDGSDWFSPSHRGHVALCQGKSPTWVQRQWLWLDVFWSCYVRPRFEPNQLLCMLMVADKKYVRYWLKHNKSWKESIIEYWGGWRGELDLASHIVKYLEKV